MTALSLASRPPFQIKIPTRTSLTGIHQLDISFNSGFSHSPKGEKTDFGYYPPNFNLTLELEPPYHCNQENIKLDCLRTLVTTFTSILLIASFWLRIFILMSVIVFRIARATRTQPLGLHFWRWAGTRHLRLLAFPLNCLISQVDSTLWFPLCSFLRNLNFAKLSPTYGLVHAKRHQLFNSLTW